MTRIPHVAEQDDADRTWAWSLRATTVDELTWVHPKPKRDWTGVWLVLACVAICAGWLALGFYLGRRT